MEFRNALHQFVYAAEWFHHHALYPQIVAPDPFHKLRVVLSFDPDPAGPGDSSSTAHHLEGAGGGSGGARGRRARRADQRDWIAIDQEGCAPEGKRPNPSLAVLEQHCIPFAADNSPAEASCGVLHHETGLGRQLRHFPAPVWRQGLGTDSPVAQ